MKNLSITIWVTTDCNMNCHYCYEGKKNGIYMKEQIVSSIVEFINKLIVKNESQLCNIRFHGGEPLLNKTIIIKLIKGIKNIETKTQIIFEMATNGYFLLDNEIKYLIDEIDEITVSIDGNRYTQNLHRRDTFDKDTFEVVFHNAIEILKIKPDIILRMTVTPDTIEMVSENIIFFIENGFKNIRPIIDYYCYSWKESQFKDFQIEMEKVKRYIEKYPWGTFNIAMATPIEFIKLGKCNGGESAFQIGTQGELYPCEIVVGDDLFLCGNIYEGVFPEWRNTLNEINNLEIVECEGCNFKEYCSAIQCRFFNYVIAGRFNKISDTLCEIENLNYILNKQN